MNGIRLMVSTDTARKCVLAVQLCSVRGFLSKPTVRAPNDLVFGNEDVQVAAK
jgi:hypothetical protein